MLKDTHFIGRDGFFWWHGVVEDRQDPDKLGRVKVRILGSHTKDKAYIKSIELQWAYIVQPVTSAAMNGIGKSPLGPVPGTWVFGFYRDGQDMQEPCVLGTIGGIPQIAPDPKIGFNDPRDEETTEKLATAPRKFKTREYPDDGTGAQLENNTEGPKYPQTDFLTEPDTHRIARHEKIEDTVLQIMTDMIDTLVPIAFTGSWDEPDIWYDGVYPYVHVEESESGSVKVLDNTPNKEGQLDFDRTGSFTETMTDGSVVRKIVMDGYTIILRNNHIHIMNDQHERIDKEYNLSVGGRWNIEVHGNINLKCHQNVYAHVLGNLHTNVVGNIVVKAGGDLDIKAANIKIDTSGKISINAGGQFHVKSGGTSSIDGSQVYFNSGRSIVVAPSDPTNPKQ